MATPLILTDIEGTTSSISFIKDVLFPYARERLAAFIQAGLYVPKKRVATRPSKAAKKRRLDAKSGRATIKRNRGKPRLDD